MPTSFVSSGESTRSTTSTLSVAEPGFRTDEPLKTFTWTSWPLRTATPTSTEASSGSPMRTELLPPLGTNRTTNRRQQKPSLQQWGHGARRGIDSRRSKDMVVVYAETWVNASWYDGFPSAREYAAVGRVRMKEGSLARKAVLMNGCIEDRPDGVWGLFNPQRAGGGQNCARDGSFAGSSSQPHTPRSRSSETGSKPPEWTSTQTHHAFMEWMCLKERVLAEERGSGRRSSKLRQGIGAPQRGVLQDELCAVQWLYCTQDSSHPG